MDWNSQYYENVALALIEGGAKVNQVDKVNYESLANIYI